jgi:hypothetical protein
MTALEGVAVAFGWLAGCWGGERGPTAFREIWTVASPDLMVGMSGHGSTAATAGGGSSFR